MRSKDSAVPVKEQYHHGNLRQTLIDLGLRRMREQTDVPALGEVGLREVAREAGVSATAVYRHFPDKKSYLQALALAGFEQLGKEQRQAMEGALLPNSQAGKKKENRDNQKIAAQAFAAVGRTYVRFAVANPSLFRLIFTSGLTPEMQLDSMSAQEGSAGWLLVQGAKSVLGPKANSTQIRAMVFQSWALVHGLSMLILDKQIAAEEGLAMLDHIVSAEE